MIRVCVGDEDGVQILQFPAEPGEVLSDDLGRNSGVHQRQLVAIDEQVAVGHTAADQVDPRSDFHGSSHGQGTGSTYCQGR